MTTGNNNKKINNRAQRLDLEKFGGVTPLTLAEVLVVMPLLLGAQNAQADGRPGGACACGPCGACGPCACY